MPSFTALSVLFPDYQNLTYVKQQKVAFPLYPLENLFYPNLCLMEANILTNTAKQRAKYKIAINEIKKNN